MSLVAEEIAVVYIDIRLQKTTHEIAIPCVNLKDTKSHACVDFIHVLLAV
jgi:hypothetical protein